MFSKEIESLDLEPMMVKAMDSSEGLGWSLEQAKLIAEEYRKYLMLCLTYPQDAIVPSSTVDDFWHLHIFDTQKYAEDCQKVFGDFLHHFPYFGMRGEKNAKDLKNAWTNSCALYEKHFGKADETIWQSRARCPNCGRKGVVGSEERPHLRVA